jgi:hypothetical protein
MRRRNTRYGNEKTESRRQNSGDRRKTFIQIFHSPKKLQFSNTKLSKDFWLKVSITKSSARAGFIGDWLQRLVWPLT